MSRFARRSAMRQSFSFHRLRSEAVAARIVAATGLAPPANVVEFGAGDGMLTRAIASRAGQVTAIEIDRGLYGRLVESLRCLDSVQALHADFRYVAPPTADYHVVANLPYSLTAETMHLLLNRQHAPLSAFLVVQREAAATWTGDGRTSLRAVQHSLRFSFDVPLALRRRDFDPWPRVESVLLAIRRRSQPLLSGSEARDFHQFVAHGFTGGNDAFHNLRRFAGSRRLRAAFSSLGVPPGASPSGLSPAAWLALWQCLQC